MLVETLNKGGFSHIVVNDVFKKQEMIGQERAFVSRLYLGVLERLIYIDNIIGRFSSTPLQKIKPVVLNILRLSIYQLLFMDSVPDFAALNEAVKLAKKRGFGSLAPFINGILRNVQKNVSELEEGMADNVKLSVPKWLYEKTVKSYGKEAACNFFKGALNAGKGVSVRLNTVKLPAETIIGKLEEEGLKLTPLEGRNCFRISGFESLTSLKSFEEGLFSVQDLSSVMAADEGCRAAGEANLIIDVCAAPGGKSICAAQNFPDSKIISRDLSESKTALIRENAGRLGLENIKAEVHDALVFDESLEGKADLVIADLPCSGLGVIGGKPDIKFRVKEKDIQSLAKLQRDILEVSALYVKEGGVLVFSTCTITPEENTDNLKAFLEGETGRKFKKESERQLLPADGSDGFFIAVLRREK